MTMLRIVHRKTAHPFQPAPTLIALGVMLACSSATADTQIFNVGAAGQTFSGVIAAANNVVKQGVGTLTFLGNNTYTGGTTIFSGVLQLGNGGTTGSIFSNVSLSGGTLAFNRSDNISFNKTISGSGDLLKQGANTLTLSGANNHSGKTTIAGGRLRMQTTGSDFFSGNFVDNGRLEFNRESNSFVDGAISGTGSLIQSGLGALVLRNANTFTGTATTYTTLDLGNGGNLASNVILGNTNTAKFVISKADDFSFMQSITGAGGLTKNGSNTVTLAGLASYDGLTTITSGTLNVAGSDNHAFGNGTTGSGQLRMSGSGNLTLTGATAHTGGTVIDGGTLRIGNGATAGSINGNIVNNAALVFDQSANATYAGKISGTGQLLKTGSNTLTLTNDNTHTGGTTIASGILELSGKGSLAGNIVNDGQLTVLNTATFSGIISGSGGLVANRDTTLLGNNTYTGGTTVNGANLLIGNGGGLTGNIVTTGASNVTFHNPGTTIYDDAISGTARLTQGAGTLILTGANTYSGGTGIISGASLQIGNGGTSGSIESNLNRVNNQGTLIFNRSDDVSYSGTLSGTGSVVKNGAGKLAIAGGVNSYAGRVYVNEGALQLGDGSSDISASAMITNNATVIFRTNSGFSSYGAYSMEGSGQLIKEGSGTLRLSGNNTYLGGTTISEGTLLLGTGYAGYGSIVGNVLNNGTLAFNRSDNLTFAGNIDGTGGLQKMGSNTLTLAGLIDYTGTTSIDGGALNIAGNGTLAGKIYGAGALTKSGAGALTLGGQNTYTGKTDVAAGTLNLTGSLDGSSAVTVASGARLVSDAKADIVLGAGSDGLLVAGELAVGADAAGLLDITLGAGRKLSFGTGAVLAYTAGANADQIAFSTEGDWLDGSGNAILQLDKLFDVDDYARTYTIFHNVSTEGFSFADIIGYDENRYVAQVFKSGSDYQLNFTVAAVPLPATLPLMLSGLGLFGFATRKKHAA